MNNKFVIIQYERQVIMEIKVEENKYKLIKDSFKIYILAMPLIAIILFIIAYITQS